MIVAKIATLEEIERWWSLKDLMDAHEALDIECEFREWEIEMAKPKGS